MPSKIGVPWFMWMVEVLPQDWKRAERIEIESGKIEEEPEKAEK